VIRNQNICNKVNCIKNKTKHICSNCKYELEVVVNEQRKIK